VSKTAQDRSRIITDEQEQQHHAMQPLQQLLQVLIVPLQSNLIPSNQHRKKHGSQDDPKIGKQDYYHQKATTSVP
jgi:hypothetical protein